jgi:hypothetical protein
MDFWTVLTSLAWSISGALLLWMIVDAVRTTREFSEDVLVSSEEAHDELLREDSHE